MNFTKALLLGVLLSFTGSTVAFAQMNFEGLDLGGKKKKAKTRPPPPKKEEKKDEGAVPMPEGGLDLTDTKPDPRPDKKSGEVKSAPTMSFDAVDVSGKSGDRQKLDVATNQFKDEKYDLAALTASELMNDPKMAGLAVESQYLLANRNSRPDGGW